jgi:glycosyltransferase involved in cell wall biosynthesis
MPRKKNRIIINGPYPPPFGGISVHIQRITQQLPEDAYILYNSARSTCPGAVDFYGKKKFLVFFRLAFTRSRLVHSHSTDPVLRIFFGILGMFHKKIYLHIHGESLTDYLDRGHLGAILMKRLIRYLNILACNSELMNKIGAFNPRSITEIDAYIPPRYDPALLDDYLRKYGEFYVQDRFVISMTGWFSYYKGEDLYGYDLAARALRRLVEEGKEVSLVLSINGILSEALYDSFLDFVRQNELEKHVLMISEDLPEAWPVFLSSQLFLRPTNTDGAAVSVKEALWAGIPVIASDCTVRPAGVTLFKNRSEDDLYDKILYFYHKPRLSMEEKRALAGQKKFNSKLFTEIYEL